MKTYGQPCTHILEKNVAKQARLQKPGQPQGWPGWPIPTALVMTVWLFTWETTMTKGAVLEGIQNKQIDA